MVKRAICHASEFKDCIRGIEIAELGIAMIKVHLVKESCGGPGATGIRGVAVP